jgi:LPXTG-motif cell wall-anchored protein
VTLDTNDITAPTGTCTITDTTYTPPVGGSTASPSPGTTTSTTSSTPDTGAGASNFVIAGLLVVLVGGLILAFAIRRKVVARR